MAMAVKREDAAIATQIKPVGDFSKVAVELEGKRNEVFEDNAVMSDEDAAMLSEMVQYVITNPEVSTFIGFAFSMKSFSTIY